VTRQVARPTGNGTVTAGYQEDYTLRAALDHARQRMAGNKPTRTAGNSPGPTSASAPSAVSAELR
jgi:hypothetical protein